MFLAPAALASEGPDMLLSRWFYRPAAPLPSSIRRSWMHRCMPTTLSSCTLSAVASVASVVLLKDHSRGNPSRHMPAS